MLDAFEILQQGKELFLRYKFSCIIGGISLMCVVLAGISLVKSYQSMQPIGFSLGEASSSGEQRSRTIKIDIGGAVANPGVYRLEEGARIEDAITAAGGLRGDVNKKILDMSINRAQKIIDGAKIYIPTIEDEQQTSLVKSDTSYNINSVQMGSTISLNSSSQQDIESLPGVGPATALKIIAGRPYITIDQLTEQKIIGVALFNKIKAQLAL